MFRPSRSSRQVPLPGPPLVGSPSEAPRRFSPSGPLPQAPLAPNRRPRPALTRYPMSQADFEAEQDYATQPTAPASQHGDKPNAALVLDQVPQQEPHLGGAAVNLGLAPAAGAPPGAGPPPGAGAAVPTAPSPTASPVAAPVVVPAAAAPAPNLGVTFIGLSQTGWSPADCALAAGPDHVLLAVNSSAALYDKGGVQQFEVTLDQWFANTVQGHKIFDPRALYDQYEDRWILVAAALGPNDSQISLFLLSISETSDPNGEWFNYALDATLDGSSPTNNWGDYPMLGVDDKALYISANMFVFNGGFAYAKIRIIDKTGPYAGNPVSFTDIAQLKDPNNNSAFTVQPCHTYGAAPQEQYFVSAVFPGSNELVLWTLTNPLSAAPVLTAQTVPVSAYGLPPKAQQPGGTIETGDTRLQNAVFRNGSVWTALTTRHNWGEPRNRAALHWFEIDPNDPSGPALVQQGVYGAQGSDYFYPAVMTEAGGNLVMVFGRSSPTEFAGAHTTGRATVDAAGTLRPSTVLQAGLARYTGTPRWGDYAGISHDPAITDTVWIYTGFDDANNDWSTAAGSVRI